MKLLKKTSQGASDKRCHTNLALKCCMLRGRSLSGNVVGWGLGALPPLLTVLLLRCGL